MKLRARTSVHHARMSLPSRERELKRPLLARRKTRHHVAPLAGARIETLLPSRGEFVFHVAPLAGARIETGKNGTAMVFKPPSLPSRERELKPSSNIGCVEPRASLPSRERELKPTSGHRRRSPDTSLPSRERELKPGRMAPQWFSNRRRSPRGSAN